MTSQLRRDDGHWVIAIDDRRRMLQGPLPLLTPLELGLFDLDEDLLTLSRAGQLGIEDERPDVVRVSGEYPDGTWLWRIEGQLDPERDYAPVRLRAVVDVPSGPTIDWRMRAQRTERFFDTFVLADAILVLQRTDPDRDRDQVYRFRLRRIQKNANLTPERLAVAIPSKNYTLLDMVTGSRRVVDATGVLREQERFDPQQRRDMWARKAALRDKAARDEARRRYVGFAILAGSIGAVVVVGVLWLWVRRRA
jgi:hypothetical protein